MQTIQLFVAKLVVLKTMDSGPFESFGAMLERGMLSSLQRHAVTVDVPLVTASLRKSV